MSNPSMSMLMTATITTGQFEIDTTCTSPKNYLSAAITVGPDVIELTPNFVKGIVTIIAGSCACPCHTDPQCDGFSNVLDVVQTVNVAFRGAAPVFDPDCLFEQTDMDCSGFSNVLDVVRIVNVAFRGNSPESQFCDGCAP